MAGADLTALSAVLKEFYVGPIAEQLNTNVLISQVLRTDAENLEGLKAVIPLHTGRSGGIGARGENVTLPTAGAQKYQRATYDLKYLYARVQVSGPAIAKTKSEAGAFLQAMKSELDGIRNDLQLDFSRQLYGDGTGAIASIPTGAAANATQTLNSNESVQKGFLYIGMTVDMGTIAAPTARYSGLTVSDVDPVNGTVTFSSAVTPTNGDFLFRAGNVVAAGPYEIDAGLQKIIATAANTVGTIDATATGNKFWDNLRDTSGTWTLDQLQTNWNKVNNAGGMADQMVLVTTPGLVRRLFATSDFKSNVRFVNSQTLQGGFEKIAFSAGSGNIELIADRLAPYGKAHFVDKNHIRLFSPADWDFLSRDGLTVRWVTDVDAFQAVLFRYVNLGTDRRNTSLVMSGLTDTGF